jgi:hypothetical protein
VSCHQAEEQPHDLHALCSLPEKETGLVDQGWAFSISLAAALHGETPVDRSGEQKAGSTSFLLRESALPCAAYRNLGHKLQRALPPWMSLVQTNRKCGVKRVHGYSHSPCLNIVHCCLHHEVGGDKDVTSSVHFLSTLF